MEKEQHLEIIMSLYEEQKRSLGLELEINARENGDRTALVFKDRKISYQELNAGANRYANYFGQLGFKTGDVVALLMKNKPEYLMAASGLSKLGVIVSLVHVGIRGDVLSHDINICEPRAVIVDEDLLDFISEVESRLKLRFPAIIYIDGEELEHHLNGRMQELTPLLKTVSDKNPESTGAISSDSILAYLYTPGASGLRKAVPFSQQRSLLKSHLFGLMGYMEEDTIHYMCLPLHYNGGLIGAYSSMLATSSTMVLKQEFSVHKFWDDIRKYKADYLMSVGEMGRYLYNQPAKEDDADNPLRVMICNGMWGSLMESFRKRFGLEHIIELYTKTEGIGNFVNHQEIPNMCGNLNLLGVRQGEVVKFDYKNKEIWRDEQGKAIKCGVAESGLLICEINQWNRFYPYVNDPEATEKALLLNVFNEGDQYFNSGDIMLLHEGDNISYIDRLGDTYRWKGRAVAANQVADVLRKFFGGIEDAVAYGVKIPGQEGRCGMAVIKLLEDETLDWKAFIKYINRRMPQHARPNFIRVASELDGDQSSEEYKEVLRQEGYDPEHIKDPIYFLHPETDQYVPLTKELLAQVINQELEI